VTSRLLILTWIPNEIAQLRVGFVVSKRISKHAVVRNHIKRLLSEAVRASLADLPPGWDIVITARSEAKTASLELLKREISTLLRRARLLVPAAHETKESRYESLE
jgi:ribonuclease P protein component